MDINKLSQSSGDNSTQMQAGTIINYNTTITGIDEERARNICREEYALARQNWTNEAFIIADERVHELESRLMPKMVAYDKSLMFFADPSFQLTLRNAMISAATSERESDYDLLTELLLHRVEQGKDRERVLGINKAIEVVNQVTEEALIGLTIVYVVFKFVPVSNDVTTGLEVLNELYGNIIDNRSLPSGEDWMEHLDLLSAIRLGSKGISKFKSMDEIIPSLLSKYLISGIDINSEIYIEIKNEFEKNGIPTNCFISYPLKSDYEYLELPSNVEQIVISRKMADGSILEEHLNNQQKEVINKAISISLKDESNDQSLKNKLLEIWDLYPNLKKVKDWFSSLSCHFSITPVGKALANAYAQEKDPNVPSLY